MAKEGSIKVKQLSAQLIPKFFKFSPSLPQDALDTQFDLCIDEELGVCCYSKFMYIHLYNPNKTLCPNHKFMFILFDLSVFQRNSLNFIALFFSILPNEGVFRSVTKLFFPPITGCDFSFFVTYMDKRGMGYFYCS